MPVIHNRPGEPAARIGAVAGVKLLGLGPLLLAFASGTAARPMPQESPPELTVDAGTADKEPTATPISVATSETERIPGDGSSVSVGESRGANGETAMEQLGGIYGAMKAEEAASLFDRLDNETVGQILRHMKQRQISAILPLMNPDKAVAITKILGG